MPTLNTSAFLITERRCKICTAPCREQIDRMILGDERRPDGRLYTFAEIVEYGASQGMAFSEASVGRHRQNHVQPAVSAALEAQKYIEAISHATGKKLSLHSAVANIIASKVLHLLNDADLGNMGLDKALKIAMRAAEVSVKLEKAERMFDAETVKEVGEKLRAKGGLTEDVIREIEEQILGLTR